MPINYILGFGAMTFLILIGVFLILFVGVDRSGEKHSKR